MAMVLHPEVQKKAQDELDTVLANGAMPQFSDRSQLPYIEALTREVVRWHPVSPQAVAHRAMEDNIYFRYFIPKGTLLIGNTWTILHDEKLYPDRPHEFVPERFLDAQGYLDKSVFNPSRVAYGYDRRICPGRHVADADIWITIASVLRTCHITCVLDEIGKSVLPARRFQNGLISHPEPFLCNVQPRSEAHKLMIDTLDLTDGCILE